MSKCLYFFIKSCKNLRWWKVNCRFGICPSSCVGQWESESPYELVNVLFSTILFRKKVLQSNLRRGRLLHRRGSLFFCQFKKKLATFHLWTYKLTYSCFHIHFLLDSHWGVEEIKTWICKNVYHSILVGSLIFRDQTLALSGSTSKAQAVNLQHEILKHDRSPDFAEGLSVDFALLDPELLTHEEGNMLCLPLPKAEQKMTSCIFIHKIVNNVNIGFWCLHNQLKFIYCSPEWVKKYDTSFSLSNYSVFFTENKLMCNREFLRTPFPQWAESLSTALHGASPHPSLCVQLHLKCCNTKIEQTAWNETWGLFLHVHKKMKIKPTVPTGNMFYSSPNAAAVLHICSFSLVIN